MSRPVTLMPGTVERRWASGMARLPVPVATSSAVQGPVGRSRWAMKSAPLDATVRAMTPKSPAIQVERMPALICSIAGAVDMPRMVREKGSSGYPGAVMQIGRRDCGEFPRHFLHTSAQMTHLLDTYAELLVREQGIVDDLAWRLWLK
jgi:hypothetical protein